MTTPATDPFAARDGTGSLTERVRGLRLTDRVGDAKSRGSASWLPWLLCLIMGLTWASFAIRAYSTGGLKGLFGGGSAAPSDAPAGPRPERPSGSGSGGASAPAAAPGEMVLMVTGNIIAAHQIQVSPIEVTGRIIKLNIEEGKFFKEGEPLAELDRTSYKADHDESKGMLDSAVAKLEEMKNALPLEQAQVAAQLKEAEEMLSQYEADLRRFKEVMTGTGARTLVAEKEYTQALYQYQSQIARVDQLKAAKKMMEEPRLRRIAAAQAEVAQAQARYDRSKWRLDNCTIRAPVSGIVLSKRAEIGNLVNPLAMNANFNAGICDMADLTDLEVDLEVQERDIRKVFVNQLCELRAKAFPERKYTARVDRIMPMANSAKQVIPIRVKVRVPRKEEGLYLKPQMSVDVMFFNKPAGPEPTEPPDPTIVND